MKIIHIITSLDDGGTEKILYNICKYDFNNQHIVISLKSSGKYFSKLKQIGIKVYSMKMSFFSILKFFYLVKKISYIRPDIVQTWLPHADLLGSFAARLANIKNIVWNIRYSKLEKETVSLSILILINFLSKLSYVIPKKIIVVSKSALKNCKNLGYCNYKLNLIQNGYDLSIFKPNKKKNLLRKKLKIKKNTKIIGCVARYDATKDHLNLLNALSILKKKDINFFCILVGSNINNQFLIEKINQLGLSKTIKLINKNNEISDFFRDIDIHVLSSKTEGFPNVVAEAMALKTPCVVTDVGDSALIVGKTGWIVPPRNSEKLSNAIEKALSEVRGAKWKKKCNLARLRIKENFEINKMLNYYNRVWSKIFNDKN